jgi:methylated-DNA-protein-cysteine methyltransferase-like protein
VRPRAEDGSFYDRVYERVRQVPPGRVTTYGTVSEALVGHAGAARTVGWALGALPRERADEVPWWRVINAAGRISISSWPGAADAQRARLEAEGVVFGPDGRTDLDRFGWWFTA